MKGVVTPAGEAAIAEMRAEHRARRDGAMSDRMSDAEFERVVVEAYVESPLGVVAEARRARAEAAELERLLQASREKTAEVAAEMDRQCAEKKRERQRALDAEAKSAALEREVERKDTALKNAADLLDALDAKLSGRPHPFRAQARAALAPPKDKPSK